MIKVALEELPGPLIARVHKFLYAFRVPERGRYVVRHVRPDGRGEEIEYRFRRTIGEQGYEEDELNTLDFLREMEQTDPGVREVLADILALVGRLEQTAPEEAIAAFTARTGVDVKG